MKPLIYTAKSAFGVAFGVGCSVVFVATMDDLIYSNLKRQVILPLQLARIRGDGRIAQETVQGTGRFIKDMVPHGLGRMSAKDLIMKDADYSTPQDHYFAYLQKMK